MSRSFGKSKKGWSKKDKERSKRPDKLRLGLLRKLAKDRLNSRKDKQWKSEQDNRRNIFNKKESSMSKRSTKSLSN